MADGTGRQTKARQRGAVSTHCAVIGWLLVELSSCFVVAVGIVALLSLLGVCTLRQ